ncbi:probable apyrase 6 isoform X1 [Phoenix dactylifera]|uniref:Probable apyrase 6 isoform X1 n=1 Tax=Phoenix dactylifera TaxID=42345 RepID=A0A8B7CN44_PHODC|nr:probable apyrase 6 isoform X1 [Phoenix dactylifera]
MRRSNARPPAIDPDSASSMDAPKPQLRPPPARLSFAPRIYSQGPKNHRTGIRFFLAAAAAAAVLLGLFHVSRISGSSKFGIIIDGGSTGTRIHVFRYSNRRGAMPVLDFGVMASMKVSPGLSAYSGNPEGARRSLVELLEFGKGRVPRNQWGETEIRLMATAGLRLLDVGVAERILDSCRKVLRSSVLQFQDDWATVISGSDEGIYAWVAANYALGSLGGDPEKTTGIVELGGASAQVTFVSSEPLPPEFSHVLKFRETTYNLYSHSFLHLGQNVAYEALHELLSSRVLKSSAESGQEPIYRDPCTPRGHSHSVELLKLSAGDLNSKTEYRPVAHATGNFSECRLASLELLQKEKDKCLHQSCDLGSAFIPKLHGKLLATENFFYTAKFFGLGPTSFLSDLMLAGEQFCGEDWLKLKSIYHSVDEEDLLRYCFSSAYIMALLHDSLGISLDEKRIGFANQVGNIPLDWALGAFIMQKMPRHSPEHSGWITAIVGNDSSILSLFVVPSVLIMAAWTVSKWRKPQLKTIYDLEKGRYIIRQVNTDDISCSRASSHKR